MREIRDGKSNSAALILTLAATCGRPGSGEGTGASSKRDVQNWWIHLLMTAL